MYLPVALVVLYLTCVDEVNYRVVKLPTFMPCPKSYSKKVKADQLF